MQVELWPIDRPKPYGKNPRKLTDKAISKVAASIKQFGFQQPIVCDAKDEIIVGHTRLQGAQKLGLKQVPVVVATDLTPAQVKAYRIADNRVAQETSWLDDILAEEFLDLEGLDFDLDQTGFDADEISRLLDDDPAESAGADDASSSSLADRFMIPPFTVLSAREGWWQGRKRAWLALGIRSELGRGENLAAMGG
jgi:ParB-like chromosome segregation protein Spo0J